MKFNPYHPLLTVPFGFLEPQIGRNQVYFFKLESMMGLLPYLKSLDGGEAYITTHDYTPQDWANHAWRTWLKKQKSNGTKIKVIGGTPSNPQVMRELIEDGIIEARIIKNPPTTHLGVFTNPRQVLFKGYQKSGSAYNVWFASEPHESAWKSTLDACKSMWNEAKPISDLEKVLVEAR